MCYKFYLSSVALYLIAGNGNWHMESTCNFEQRAAGVSAYQFNDIDKDGIVDSLDHCPNTTTGAVVDKYGCEIADAKASVDLLALARKIQFNKDSYKLTETSFKSLDAVARLVQKYPGTLLLIEGYTDNSGSPDVDLALSVNRVGVIRDYLTEQGIDAKRLNAHGFGARQQVAKNNTERGRAKNNRILLILTKTK